MALRTITDLQLAPDGRRIVYTVSSPDPGQHGHDLDLWVVDLDGRARQLTSGPGGDRAPRWAPDGRTIAFLSDRAGGDAIWTIGADGGSAERVAATAGASAFEWSPD